MRSQLTAAALLTLLARPVAAEAPPACAPGAVLLLDGLGTPSDDLARLAELASAAPASSQLIRRGGFRVQPVCAEAKGFGWLGQLAVPDPAERGWLVLPARLEATWNSQYPYGGNDGLLVAGRGFSSQARVGVAGRWGVVSAALAPELAWQQNRWFQTVPTGKPGALALQNPWYGDNLDVPQRFGNGPFARAALGQSYLRVDAFGAAAGLSTENLWLGPGLHDAILLTNNAPGFPHLFLGTSKPADIYIGSLEVLALWGRVGSSRYVSARSHPWFSALVATYQPRWIPGLYLGGGRAILESWASLRRNHLLSLVSGPFGILDQGGNRPDNNRFMAGWIRWAMPEAGFELYGEWARDDTAASPEALLRDPERTQGWVWGFQKLLRAGPRTVRVQVEITRLHDVRPPTSPSGLPIWYTHGSGVDYTNGGQLLGASTGPGGDSQRLAVDLLTASGRVGGFVERTARNEETYWSAIDPLPGRSGDHDVEAAGGYRQVLLAGPAEVSLELSAAFRWNRDFMHNEPNFRGAVQVAWPTTP
jgi:Capsule assembly protein Wzi